MADTHSESTEGELYRGSPEDLSFIDNMADIARRQAANCTAAAVLGEFSTSRYKNNWDDLDVLCAELTHRETLSKKTGVVYAVEFDNFDNNLHNKETSSNCEEVTFEHFNDSSTITLPENIYSTESRDLCGGLPSRNTDLQDEVACSNSEDNVKTCRYYETECKHFEDNLLRSEEEITAVTHPSITESSNRYFPSDSRVFRFVSNNNNENCDKKQTVRTTGLNTEALNIDKDIDLKREFHYPLNTGTPCAGIPSYEKDCLKNQNSNNNNNNICMKSDNQVLVPPPRKKKMARLKAAEKTANPKVDRIKDDTKRQSSDTPQYGDKDNNAALSDSGISASTYNGLHTKTSSITSSCDSADTPRESSENESKFSESLGSECEQAILSAVAEANANEWADEKNDDSFETNIINEKDSTAVYCEAVTTNDVIYRNKKRGRDNETRLTGLTVDCDSSEAYVYHPACQFISRQATRSDFSHIEGEFVDGNLSPGVPDNIKEDRRRIPPVDLPRVLITKSSHICDAGQPDLNRSECFDDCEGNRTIGQSTESHITGIDRYPADYRYPHSIYVDPSDLERIDGSLVVKPAVRRFSVSQEDEASRSSREAARLRRNSTTPALHQEADTWSTDDGISRHRSKSVSDLTRTNVVSSSGLIKRDRSVSNRVSGAVGKLSLRIRHAFRPKSPSPKCYIEESPEDTIMSNTNRKLNCDSKCDKKSKRRSSKDFMDIDADYAPAGRPVLATQPSDVKAVHSYSEATTNTKPKGKFSSLFGLGGKKWYTIASLPKLLKRKSKDKYSKSDRASSASDQDSGSIASAPVVGGKSKIVVTGRHAANAKDKIAKDRRKRHEYDELNDLPTFISLAEYRLRMEEIEYRRQLEEKRGGMGKRTRSLPYLDTSEEEEQAIYNTMRAEKGRTARAKLRSESSDENRTRYQDKDQRRISEPIDKTDKRRRYKRRDKGDNTSPEELPFLDVDKSTMAIDYGCDMYHFKGHPSIARPHSTSDLTYSSGTEAYDRSVLRYSNQPRNRNSVAAPEDRGRRRALQPRDRNSIAVPNISSSESQRLPERRKKEKLQRPKSMSSLLPEESLSSEEDATGMRRRREHKKPKAPQPNERRRDSSPDVDPLEDAIKKHLKHENGPLARRKIERKQTQETGSMRRLKESFMAKKIWENVYDQLLKDLSGKGSNSAAKKALESM